MMGSRRFAVWIVLAITLCGPAAAQQDSRGPDGQFMVDGRALAVHCSLGSAPTVVIDAGLGDW
jgi:hypothetical protein